MALQMSPEIFDAAVGNNRNAFFRGGLDAVLQGGELGHADTGDDAGGADRARADADLDTVGAGLDQSLGGLAGGDVAGDDLQVREVRP